MPNDVPKFPKPALSDLIKACDAENPAALTQTLGNALGVSFQPEQKVPALEASASARGAELRAIGFGDLPRVSVDPPGPGGDRSRS